MRTYKEFIITTNPFDVETVSGMLWQLDIDGITEFDDYLIVFSNESKNIKSTDIEEILQKLKTEKFIESFEIKEETIEDKNWNEEFEKNTKIIEVSDRIVIKPSFKKYDSKPGQLIITIDPKMSFGTGDHSTTKLVIRFLENYIKGQEKVLDVGSGTCILGITAVKLGAENAVCIDNDEWCLLNGKENVKANNLSDKVEVKLGELKDIDEANFDLVTANINKHILIDIVGELKSKIKKTGILILSGLLIIDEHDIINIYEAQNFSLIAKSTMDEWISMVLINN